MTELPTTCGLVGFGLVGAALAERIDRAGIRVMAVEVDSVRKAALASSGTAQVATLETVVAAADAIVLAVYDDAQVLAVLDQVTQVSARPPVIVCVTTIAPATAERIATDLPDLHFIECPLSGTSNEIAQGEALGLVAGRRDLFDRWHGFLSVVSPRLSYFGDQPGAAARAKLAINLVLEVNRSALAEGLALATAFGLDPALFGDALQQSAAGSTVMRRKLPKLLAADFAAEGRCGQSLRDVGQMRALADRLGLELPLIAAQHALLSRAVAAGDGDFDSCVVARHLRAPTTTREIKRGLAR